MALSGGNALAFDPSPASGDQPTTAVAQTTPVPDTPVPTLPKLSADGDALVATSRLPVVTSPVVTTVKRFVAKARALAVKQLLGKIQKYQRERLYWSEEVMGISLPALKLRRLAHLNIPDLRTRVRVLKRQTADTRRRAQHPPDLVAFMCIHGGEAPWNYDKNALGHNGLYDGGLQMDINFQRTYAPHLLRTKGTANHWTPLEQIWTAERAHQTRGFGPWPNTRKPCHV
jgi:hypothetical protein